MLTAIVGCNNNHKKTKELKVIDYMIKIPLLRENIYYKFIIYNMLIRLLKAYTISQ